MVLQHTLEALPQSLITSTKSTKSFLVDTTTKSMKEANMDKAKIGVGTSITAKVREIDEKIREGERRRTRKELVGLYYLAHISSILVLSQF